MLGKWGRLTALFAASLTAAPLHAQAQDQDARSAIMALQAEIQRLRSEVAALQVRVDRQEQVVVQTPAGLQIGNAGTRRLAIVTARGTAVLERDGLTVSARSVAINGEQTVAIRSDTIALDARVTNVKGSGDQSIKGMKVGAN